MRKGALLLLLPALLLGCPPEPLPAPRPPAEDEAAIALVETPPVETTLDHADIPHAADVWLAMIDGAHHTLDFAEFYASEAEQKDRVTSKLSPIVAAVERAVTRGVKVRFLADSAFAPKYPETLERLRNVGAQVRIVDFGKRGGGVLHAKYFVVDGVEAYVGSQNFDWRSLDHIQEMGVRVWSPVIAGALLDVLDTDWELAAGAAADARVQRRPRAVVRTRSGETLTLVASPRGWLPDESSWELPRLVALLDGSRRSVDLQVLTYKTKERDGSPFPTLDEALRRAAGRGVHVRLLVSDWSSKPGSDGRATLEDLAKVANVEVRVITIPPWSGGPIPFARVAHAKYLVIDRQRAWVGTSNWEGDYFTKSRNVGVIAEGGPLAPRLDGVFDDGWSSAYAKPLAAVSAGSAAPPSSSDPAPP
ncbi:MAG TPA: phospholipase D-like domain-containing protein [Labilithrix sp.]|nr:phospholipase D-like domain-containing protein [Labilithrix sp.]